MTIRIAKPYAIQASYMLSFSSCHLLVLVILLLYEILALYRNNRLRSQGFPATKEPVSPTIV